MVINLVFGVGISLLLVRYEFPGKRLLSALIDVPLSVSPVVVGLALLLVYNGRDGWFGPTLESAGVQIIFATPGMIMATAFVALPLVIREVVPVLEEIGDEQEQAARSLGANAVQTFRRITLPSIKWAVVYGVVLSLARSLGEFGAVKIVSGNIVGKTQTATLVVEQKYQNFEQATAYAVAFLLAFAAVVCIVIVSHPASQGRTVMSIEVAGISKRFGDFVALDDVSVDHPHRAAHRAARAQRRRQVHAAAHHRRARDPPTPGTSSSRASRPRTCRRRSATWASSSSTTPPSSTCRWPRTSPSAWRSASGRRPRSRRGWTSCSSSCTSSQFAHRLPSQLSGGQRQRMALARALAVEPKVLLLDEPFGALDAKVRKELREWLRRLHDEVHVTTVFVTHDQEEALEVADEIVVINDGRIEQIGTPDQLYDQPGERLRDELPRPGHLARRPAGPSARHRRASTDRVARRGPRRDHPDRPGRLRGAARACAPTTTPTCS